MKIQYHSDQRVIEPLNTFIIPFCWTYTIEDCVARIWRFNDSKIHRLILVDNTCEEGDFEKRLRDQSHLYIKSYRNLGGNMGWNLGAKIATTKYITIMGDDTLMLHKSWWDATYKQMQRSRITFSKNVKRLFKKGERVKDEYSEEELVRFGVISNGRGYIIHAVTMERELLEELGYFEDAIYPKVFADTSLKSMINKSGKRENIGYLCPGAYVWHEVGGSHHGVGGRAGISKRHTTKLIDKKSRHL